MIWIGLFLREEIRSRLLIFSYFCVSLHTAGLEAFCPAKQYCDSLLMGSLLFCTELSVPPPRECNYVHICRLFGPQREWNTSQTDFEPFKFPVFKTSKLSFIINKRSSDVSEKKSTKKEETAFISGAFCFIFNLIIWWHNLNQLYSHDLWQNFDRNYADWPPFASCVLRSFQYNNATQCKWLTVTRSAKLQLKCSFDSLIMHMIKTKVAGSWAKIFLSLMPTIKRRSVVFFYFSWAF